LADLPGVRAYEGVGGKKKQRAGKEAGSGKGWQARRTIYRRDYNIKVRKLRGEKQGRRKRNWPNVTASRFMVCGGFLTRTTANKKNRPFGKRNRIERSYHALKQLGYEHRGGVEERMHRCEKEGGKLDRCAGTSSHSQSSDQGN